MHSMSDLFRKTTKPSTYPCKLCSLTYNGAFMKKMWKEYIASLNNPTVFMHRDEFAEAYPNSAMRLPVVLLEQNGSFTILVGSDDFRHMNDLTDLISLISERLTNARK